MPRLMPIQDDIDTPLALACRKAGGQSALARLIGKHQTTISDQLFARGQIWAEDVLTIERELGISRHELRPDLYPLEDTQPARHPAEQPPAGSPTSPAGGSSSGAEDNTGIEGIAA